MEEKELNVKEEEKEVDSFLDAMKEADELKNNEAFLKIELGLFESEAALG